MARWITVAGDREPVLRAWLRNKNSEAITWAGASVKLQLRIAGVITEKNCTILDSNATSAQVEYQWAADDGLVAGTHAMRFQATLASGKKMTFPKGSWIDVVVNS